MFIPEEKISEILSSSDIIEVISDSVTLKKNGSNYVGLCPFHSEKTPSFSVSPQKQIFHCFGCSAGGNALSFLMKHHGISFPEAANILAKKYGIVLESRDISIQDKQKLELKEGLFRINTRVREYYAEQLQTSPSASSARGYLERRAITPDTINEFGMGYAPDKWDSIVSLLRRMKLSKSMAEQSGLVLRRKTGSGYYDRFRNRIIFPIFDPNMQVAGFGGRVMDDSMPKYLNSPETPIYSKGRILYGLHASKRYCRQKGTVYIVEGYFDFISLYQNGIKNCVATLGTALTVEHVRLLKGYSSKIFIVFDSDAAGVNAARRSVEFFIKEGIELRIVLLPKGYDPDSFVREYGAQAFESESMKAMSAIEFLTKMALEKYGLSIEGKVATLEEIKKYLAAIPDSTARSLYIREISHRLGIDEVAVLEKVRQVIAISQSTASNDNSLAYTQPTANWSIDNLSTFNSSIVCSQPIGIDGFNIADYPVKESGSPANEYEPREQQIISMMLQFPEIINEIKKLETLECFYSSRLRNIGRLILNVAASCYADSDYVQKTGSYDNESDVYGRETALYGNGVNFYSNNTGLVGYVIAAAKNEADRELIASLAMVELADVDDIMAKIRFLVKRIINVRKRNDSTLIHEIRRVEHSKKRAKNIQTAQGTKEKAGHGVKAEQDSDTDPTLELLRQRQIEIRQLRGYE